MEATLQAIQNLMEPYDGKDPDLRTERICSNCYEGESERHLRRCGRCSSVWYCSVACQKANFKEHQAECKEIKRLRDKTEEERLKLLQLECMFGGPPENAFEEHVGLFWGVYETRDYCRARNMLARALHDVAYRLETVESWNGVLEHQLELIRLIRQDNMGIRHQVPYTLLYLNRDDDVVDFIRYWYTDANEEDDIPDYTSQPGSWIYGRTPNARLQSIFATHPKINPRSCELAFLVALLIVKLRIIAKLEARAKTFELFSKTKSAKLFNRDVLAAIRMHIVGDPEVGREQERQTAQLIDLIQKRNATMLPSLIHPDPMISQPTPFSYSSGSPSEAYFVLNDSHLSFVRVPGAEKRIIKIYGENPEYNHKLGGL